MKCELCHYERAIARYVVPAEASDRGTDISVLACERCLWIPAREGWKITPLHKATDEMKEAVENVIKLHGGPHMHEWLKVRIVEEIDSYYDLMECRKCGARWRRYAFRMSHPPDEGCSKEGGE